MKRLLHLGLVLAVIFSLIACERNTQIAPSGIKLKVGVIAPLTGPIKGSGESGLNGIKVAAKVRSHLDNGDEIELVIEDDQSNPSKALEKLEKLATVDHVAAILILSRSDTVIDVAKVADKYQTPILSTIASSPEVTKFSHFVSQLSFDDTFQALAAALYVRDELLMDRVAVFSLPDNPHHAHLRSEFIEKFKSVGGIITDDKLITTNNKLNEMLDKARLNNPSLLYVPAGAENVLRITEYLQGVDWKPVILGTDGLLAKVLSDYSEKLSLVDGMLATDLFYDDMDLTRYGEKLENVIASEKIIVNTNSTIAMEAYGVLVNAMNRCDPPVTRECINKKLRSTKNFEGVMGFISIDSTGKAHRPLIINSIEAGKLNFIVKVY